MTESQYYSLKHCMKCTDLYIINILLDANIFNSNMIINLLHQDINHICKAKMINFLIENNLVDDELLPKLIEKCIINQWYTQIDKIIDSGYNVLFDKLELLLVFQMPNNIFFKYIDIPIYIPDNIMCTLLEYNSLSIIEKIKIYLDNKFLTDKQIYIYLSQSFWYQNDIMLKYIISLVKNPIIIYLSLLTIMTNHHPRWSKYVEILMEGYNNLNNLTKREIMLLYVWGNIYDVNVNRYVSIYNCYDIDEHIVMKIRKEISEQLFMSKCIDKNITRIEKSLQYCDLFL